MSKDNPDLTREISRLDYTIYISANFYALEKKSQIIRGVYWGEGNIFDDLEFAYGKIEIRKK